MSGQSQLRVRQSEPGQCHLQSSAWLPLSCMPAALPGAVSRLTPREAATGHFCHVAVFGAFAPLLPGCIFLHQLSISAPKIDHAGHQRARIRGECAWRAPGHTCSSRSPSEPRHAARNCCHSTHARQFAPRPRSTCNSTSAGRSGCRRVRRAALGLRGALRQRRQA